MRLSMQRAHGQKAIVGSWLGLVLSVWQGDRRIRKMRLP